MGDEDQEMADHFRQMIETMFTYHAPKGNQLDRYQQLRAKGKELALLIADLTPPSEDQAMAVHHVSMAIMLANAAIARWDEESDYSPAQGKAQEA